jgi:deoxycytidine triphosphate deaminase
MSILIKSQILEQVKSGKIAFDPPLDQFQVQCHAVDLRLGFTFLIPKQWHLTPKGREALNLDYFHLDRSKYFDVLELEKGQYFEILPNEYVMVSTLESVKLPLDLMAVLYPRSSINRRGLSVELSGIITAGYEGQLIIPVKNNTQAQIIKLYPGKILSDCI